MRPELRDLMKIYGDSYGNEKGKNLKAAIEESYGRATKDILDNFLMDFSAQGKRKDLNRGGNISQMMNKAISTWAARL